MDWLPPGTPDGRSELPFPTAGLELEVSPISFVEVDVAAFASNSVALEGYDEDGDQLDSDTIPEDVRTRYTLRVRGDRITDLLLKGGDSEGVLIRVCLGPTGRQLKNIG